MNRSQLRSRAALHAEDPQQTRFANYFNDALDESATQFALDSKCLYKDASTITVVSGTSGYPLPTDFMYERRVTFDGDPLKPISRATLDFYKRTNNWSDDTGSPVYYFIDPEEAVKKIQLYPIPQGDDAGKSVILTYYPKPAAMTSDSDVPLNSSLLLVQYHEAIAQYAAWLLLGYNKQDAETIAKRNILMNYYLDRCAEAQDKFGNTVSEPIRLRGGRVW